MSEKEIGNVPQIARTLTDHLPQEIDSKLKDLIAQAETGQDTTIEIINLLAQNKITRNWMKEQITSMNRKRSNSTTPSYGGLAGDPFVPPTLKWVCPKKPDEHWMMVMQEGEPPPACKIDNIRMVRGR